MAGSVRSSGCVDTADGSHEGEAGLVFVDGSSVQLRAGNAARERRSGRLSVRTASTVSRGSSARDSMPDATNESTS